MFLYVYVYTNILFISKKCGTEIIENNVNDNAVNMLEESDHEMLGADNSTASIVTDENSNASTFSSMRSISTVSAIHC